MIILMVINCFGHKMSEDSEKCPSQFPKAQDDVLLWLPNPKKCEPAHVKSWNQRVFGIFD